MQNVARAVVRAVRLRLESAAPPTQTAPSAPRPRGPCACAPRVAYLDLTGSGVETLAHVKVRRAPRPLPLRGLPGHSLVRARLQQCTRGEGARTGAHHPSRRAAPQENGRITFMFASFDAVPCITRLFGRAVAHERGTPDFEKLVAEAFPAAAEAPAAAAAPGSGSEAAAGEPDGSSISGGGGGAAGPAAAGPAAAAYHPGFAAGARSVIVADVYEVTTACGYAVPLYDFRAERDTLVSWSENKGPEALDEYRAAHASSLDGMPALAGGGATGA
jgi:hypothetical protein